MVLTSHSGLLSLIFLAGRIEALSFREEKNEIFTFLQFYWEKVKEIVILTKVLFRVHTNLHLSCSSFCAFVHLICFGPHFHWPAAKSYVSSVISNCLIIICFKTHICEWPSVKSRNSGRNKWLTPVFRKKKKSVFFWNHIRVWISPKEVFLCVCLVSNSQRSTHCVYKNTNYVFRIVCFVLVQLQSLYPAPLLFAFLSFVGEKWYTMALTQQDAGRVAEADMFSENF